MTAATESLFRLPAKPIATLLTELCQLRHRGRSGETLEVPAVTVYWGELPNTDEIYQSLTQLLTDLQSILLEIATDELGRTALQQGVQRLEINTATTPQVRLHQQVLQVQGKLDRGNLDFQPKPDLRRAVIALL